MLNLVLPLLVLLVLLLLLYCSCSLVTSVQVSQKIACILGDSSACCFGRNQRAAECNLSLSLNQTDQRALIALCSLLTWPG